MSALVWTEPDGSVPHAVAHADGQWFNTWTIYDAVAIDFGDAAEIMRGCLIRDAKRFEVEFPDGERRRYVSLAAARAAVEKSAS